MMATTKAWLGVVLLNLFCFLVDYLAYTGLVSADLGHIGVLIGSVLLAIIGIGITAFTIGVDVVLSGILED